MKQGKNIALALVCAMISTSFTLDHEYYVSVGEMILTEHHFDVKIRLFSDDLEYTLTKENGAPIDVLNSPEASELTANYLHEHFKLYDQNGKAISFQLVSLDGDPDAMVAHLETSDVSDVTEVQVFNDILIDYFTDQINILKVGSGEARRSFRFDKDLTIQQIPAPQS